MYQFKTDEATKQYNTLCAELRDLVEAQIAQIEYRKVRNQREDVRAKRKQYNKERNAKIKKALALLQEE